MGLDELRAFAATQHQLVLTRDLPRFGVGRGTRDRLLSQGWLVDVRRGVVGVGGGPVSAWQMVVAASLVAGEHGAMSHLTAARIHRFACVAQLDQRDVVEISVPQSARIRLTGCVVHRVRHLPAEHVTLHRGVRVTTPLRTLLDLAPVLAPAVLEKTVDEGLIARLWTPAALAEAVAAPFSRRRAGIDSLRRLMQFRTELVDSHLEQQVATALHSLGPFETGYQLVLDGKVYILDLAWPAYRVAAECDGWTTRSRSRSKFDHDRRKDNHLASHGWSVVHLTSAMSDDEMRAAVVRVLLQAAARQA